MYIFWSFSTGKKVWPLISKGVAARPTMPKMRRIGAVLLNASGNLKLRKQPKLPTHERQCAACGRKFESYKTAKKHKCSKASGQASQATPTASWIGHFPAKLTPMHPLSHERH